MCIYGLLNISNIKEKGKAMPNFLSNENGHNSTQTIYQSFLLVLRHLCKEKEFLTNSSKCPKQSQLAIRRKEHLL
jgi:hypothetical protein